MLLRLKQVSKFYPMGDREITALDGVSFEVVSGDFVAVMGPSGSGKSTLLNVIGCLHKPSKGALFLEDINVEGLSERELAGIRNQKIGFVFQSFHLFPSLSALKNVQIPLIYKGFPKGKRYQSAIEVLRLVVLEARVDHRPGELSGGEQQRVAIARALVTNPSLLLADEPTGNLDSASGHEIMDLFELLNKNGMTVIAVTHQDSVASYARRVITLKDGRIVSDGTGT